jgi:hypothetical protein
MTAHRAESEHSTPGCNCASRGLAEEHRHSGGCPYGKLLRDPSVQGVTDAIVEQMAGMLWATAGAVIPWDLVGPEVQQRYRKAAADTLLADIDRRVNRVPAEFGEEMEPHPCPQCGEIDCMEDTHDG